MGRFSQKLEFLELCLTTGIVRKPSLNKYWTRNELLSTPYFPKVTSFNKFILTSSSFSTLQLWNVDHDRLHKIRPFYDTLIRHLPAVYSPEQEICIDESLILFKGRLIFKQLHRSKRAHFGLKSYEFCKTKWNG